MLKADFREFFIESFLYEQPKRIPDTDTFGFLLRVINDYKNSGVRPEKLGSNLSKIELKTIAYYWYENDENIPVLIIELEKKEHSVAVSMVGKSNSGTPPWATDMYDAILRDRGESVSVESDQLLSDGGFSIWKRLLQHGRKISVYDVRNPGISFKKIETMSQLQDYSRTDNDDRYYRFVLSENQDEFIEAMSYFLARRNKELAGML